MHAEPLGLRGARVGNLCPRHIVCLRSMGINTLHKGGDDDDDDDNNNNNRLYIPGWALVSSVFF